MRRSPVRRDAALAAAALAAAWFALRQGTPAPSLLARPQRPDRAGPDGDPRAARAPSRADVVRDAVASTTDAPLRAARGPRHAEPARALRAGPGVEPARERPSPGAVASAPASAVRAAPNAEAAYAVHRLEPWTAPRAASADMEAVATATRAKARRAAPPVARRGARASSRVGREAPEGDRAQARVSREIARGGSRPRRGALVGRESKAPSPFTADAPVRQGRGRRERPRLRRSRRFRPLLLATLLGSRPLTPPPPGLRPPAALDGLAALRPSKDASGAPVPAAPAGLAGLDQVDPEKLHRDRRAGAHWDGDEWHDGAARGLKSGDDWRWLYRDGPRWWALTGDPERPALRHDGLWWTKAGGVWFVVHDGEPWAWRPFQDWGAQGLFSPATGTEMVYSRDLSRVAVITPGDGAEVFDARTGAALGRIPEDRMPPRRRPRFAPPADPAAVFGR